MICYNNLYKIILKKSKNKFSIDVIEINKWWFDEIISEHLTRSKRNKEKVQKFPQTPYECF